MKARVLIDDDVKGAVGPRDVSELVEALGFSCELISGGKIIILFCEVIIFM